jgi:DUF4097 and DUF4098 domain-containing protein YvlB
MKKYKKIFLTSMLALILGALILGSLILYGFANPDVIRASDEKIRLKQGLYKQPIEKVIVVEEDVDTVLINIPSKSVSIVDSDVEKITITYYEDYEGETQYQITDKTLNFELSNKKIIFNVELLSWIYKDYRKVNSVRIEIPHGLILDYNVALSSGNLRFDKITTVALKANVKSGNISINNLSANNAELKLSCGNLTINNSNFAQNLSSKNDCGNVIITSTTSEAMQSYVSCGNTSIADCVALTLKATSKSGNITLERLQANDMTINNSSGNIKIYELVYQLDDYSYSLKTSSGYVKVNGSKKGNYYEHLDSQKLYNLTASVSSGNIIIN